jgi:hypothetical protein
MNVIFHTTAAIGATVLLTDTARLGGKPTLGQIMPTAFYTFLIGIILHGALDFIPHCYPINSKVDAVAGLSMILTTVWLTNRHYRPISGLACLGSIFPDVVDLGPKIINKQLNLGLTLPDNIFPWHWHEYSGSLYHEPCNVSTLNHFVLLLTTGIILWTRRTDLKAIVKKSW